MIASALSFDPCFSDHDYDQLPGCSQSVRSRTVFDLGYNKTAVSIRCECGATYEGNPYLVGGCTEHEECVKCRRTGGNCLYDPVYNVDLKLIWNVTCLPNENRNHGFEGNRTSLGVILGVSISMDYRRKHLEVDIGFFLLSSSLFGFHVAFTFSIVIVQISCRRRLLCCLASAAVIHLKSQRSDNDRRKDHHPYTPAAPRHSHRLSDQLFYRTPQVGPTTGGHNTAVHSNKKRSLIRLLTFPNIFRN
ncbi:hypothetical protein L1887_07738 [Cichorium endivia]|nr:hypothetical protein L1887_07738 [Cichorium endivia]